METTNWNIHWQMKFASKDGNVYTVNVYDKDYTGAIVPLIGGPEPFVTQEDDDDDYFAALRGQTGYLRVIDNTGTGMLMDDIVPDNNTQRMVRLYLGDEIKWQGFIQSQAYSQAWDKETKLVEFPIKSFLAALEDLKMVSEISSPTVTFQSLIEGAQKLAGITPWEKILVASDITSNPIEVFKENYVISSFFFDRQTDTVEGTSTISYVGISYYEAWEKMLKFLGLTARESGSTLIIEQFDHPGYNLKYSVTSWKDFTTGIWVKGQGEMLDMQSKDLLSVLDFQDNDNSIGYTTGASVAKVQLDIKSSDEGIQLPAVEETSDTPIELVIGSEKKKRMIVQIHEPVNSDTLKYGFSYYENIAEQSIRDFFTSGEGAKLVYKGTTDYPSLLAHSVLKGYSDLVYVFRGYGYRCVNKLRYTGVFPIRFYYKQDETSINAMSDGYWIQTQYYPYRGKNYDKDLEDWVNKNYAGHIIMTVSSVNVLNLENGYINIKLSLYSIHDNESSGDDAYKDVNIGIQGHDDPTVVLKAHLKAGGKYYDEENKTWTDEVKNITLKFKDGSLVTNKTEDMITDSNEGYFAPISGTNGEIVLELLDVNEFEGGDNSIYCTTALILHSFSIDYLPKYSVVASERDSNIYQQIITTNGFSAEKRIDLDMGTINNNQDSPSFVHSLTAGTYLTKFAYNGKNGDSYERPEIHLLGRLAKYCQTMRRNMKAVVKTGLDLFTTVYTYRKRKFFGIDTTHNWRDDTQEVKFVEITNDNE